MSRLVQGYWRVNITNLNSYLAYLLQEAKPQQKMDKMQKFDYMQSIESYLNDN